MLLFYKLGFPSLDLCCFFFWGGGGEGGWFNLFLSDSRSRVLMVDWFIMHFMGFCLMTWFDCHYVEVIKRYL
ncbi:hypothetical protein DFH28DRAFT_950173 [Melampsora americana]|nr:hypothetical protein DFH28DRAFT_950173 [Melampsora americana]